MYSWGSSHEKRRVIDEDLQQTPSVHGSARFATREEAAQFQCPQHGQHFLPLGQSKHQELLGLTEQQQERHVLLVGPTDKGKSSTIVIPGLLQECGSRSLFISDPKQELVRSTAGALARHHHIRIFAPRQPAQSARYNPLAFVHTMADARNLAACWIANTGTSERDPFWDRVTAQLITATILHLREAEPDAPFCRLADLASLPFARVKAMLLSSPSAIARDTATSLIAHLALTERTAGSVFADFTNRLFLLKDPELRQVTSTNELDFVRMLDEPTALYLSIPRGAAKDLRPLSSCLLMQMFTTWTQCADHSSTGALPRGIACYLDEFTNAGQIPDMETHVTTLRSARVALILAIQSFAQLEHRYGAEVKQTILANTTTHLVFPGAGLEECSYYSERIGNRTETGKSTSASEQTTTGSTITGTSYSETRRRLMDSNEIRTMPRGQLLMLVNDLHPIKLWSTPYYQDPELVALSTLPYQPPALPVSIPPLAPAPEVPHDHAGPHELGTSEGQEEPSPLLALLRGSLEGRVLSAQVPPGELENLMPPY